MDHVLSFLRDVLKEPALLLGIVSCIGLISLKAKWHKVLVGTLGPILGYIMLGIGASAIVSSLEPLGQLIEHGFKITGVIPNNEAVVATAQKLLGIETMSILVVGLIINVLIARFTKYKYVFLTGHHSFFMACLLSAVLGALGFKNYALIVLGGFFLGAWSAISPAIGQKYTLKVTDYDDIAIETMSILVVGLIINVLIARFTKYKYVFLTGHHSFFMACLLSAVLGALGFKNYALIVLGGFFLGAWSAISPAIGQKYTLKVTDYDDIAMGHFGSIGYYLSAWIGSKVGNPEDSAEKIKIPEQFGFLRNTTISTAITMLFFYLLCGLVAGFDFVQTLSDGQSALVFLVMTSFKFAVGVTVVYSGVRMILSDLIPAFQGIARKVIPNAIPAVDCAVFFTYAQTSVIIGFIFSFIGGIVGMLILGFSGAILIIPGLVPHFFCGATAGIYGNATGGKKGAIIGSFFNGLLITFFTSLIITCIRKIRICKYYFW